MIRCFRWFLLLCVVLNLGDAPYVDEILADAGNPVSLTSASTTDREQASSPQNDGGGIKVSAYENLLANIPIPAESIASNVSAIPSNVVPAFDGDRIPVPPVSRLERPPRTAAFRLA